MWIKYIFLAFCGLCAGGFLSAGFFALITSVGIVTTFASKTHTGKKILTYETFIVLGAFVGNSFWVLCEKTGALPNAFGLVLLSFLGLFYGMFVGSFIMSLAESVKAIPIFFRRGKIRYGLGIIVVAIAIGKCLGNLWHIALY